MATTPEFKYAPMFQLGKDDTEYYLLTKDYVSVGEFEGKPMLKIAPEGLTAMANAAFRDVSFLLRRAHNEQVAKILSDPEASDNDKYVALTFLRNADRVKVACLAQLFSLIGHRNGEVVYTVILQRFCYLVKSGSVGEGLHHARGLHSWC